jgi:hypothetical protein
MGVLVRRDMDLSTDAVAVLLFISRQRLRLQQHISFSEIREGLEYDGSRTAAAIAECVQGGWLILESGADGEPCCSMLSTGRRRIAKLVPKLN